MFAVPALTPVTTPVELTVAAALSLLQVPDSPLPVSVLVNPLQTDSVPDIVGSACIVMIAMFESVVLPLV
jgi:hypothetical protein